MSMRALSIIVGVVLPIVAQAHTADQLIAFAEHLTREGDDAAALLEYKRFCFHHPSHARIGDATLQTARLMISHHGDIPGARQSLKALIDRQPGTESANTAQGFLQFIDNNLEFEGKPLVLYLRARAHASSNRPKKAEKDYEIIVTQYHRAKLNEKALFELARLQIEQLNKPVVASNYLIMLTKKYPQSPLVPEARFYIAMAVEKQQGPSEAARTAYQQVAAAYPHTQAGQRAAERVTMLENKANIVKRKYDKTSVAQYTVLKAGYFNDRHELLVIVKLPIGISEPSIEATLEDALLAYVPQRTDRLHHVKVEGYYNYPLTEAGTLKWQPGGEATVKMKKRRGEDIATDVLFELLKR